LCAAMRASPFFYIKRSSSPFFCDQNLKIKPSQGETKEDTMKNSVKCAATGTPRTHRTQPQVIGMNSFTPNDLQARNENDSILIEDDPNEQVILQKWNTLLSQVIEKEDMSASLVARIDKLLKK
jgi:hypothetical protein